MAQTTEERLLVTAERLFAERGIAAVSLREIGAAAGQRNNSAAQYHFGSKQGLVHAILAHRMPPINARRLEMLAALDRTGRVHELRALVEAFVIPLAEAARPGSFYVRFLAQLLAGPADGPRRALELEVLSGMRRLLAYADAALGGLPARLRTQRLRRAAALLIHSLAEHERDQGHRQAGSPLALVSADLVDVIVAMLHAPVSADTRRELRLAARERA